MARARSMIGSGILGAKMILVGTGVSFDPRFVRGLGGEEHVGRAANRHELARAVGDARLAESDAATATEEPSLRADLTIVGRGEEAHIEVEGGLAHAARCVLVGR